MLKFLFFRFRLLWVALLICASADCVPALGALATSAVGTTEAPEPEVRPSYVSRMQSWINRRLETNNCNVLAPAALPSGADETGWWVSSQYRASASDTGALYQLAAGHLALGRQMLSESSKQKQLQGLGIILQAARACQTALKDEQLAVAIFDGWILPNLNVVTEEKAGWLSKKNILNEAENVYEAAKDIDRMEKLQKLIMVQLTDPNDVDLARCRLSRIAEKRGNLQLALEYLNGIDSTQSRGMVNARRRIKALEQEISRNNNKKSPEKKGNK